MKLHTRLGGIFMLLLILLSAGSARSTASPAVILRVGGVESPLLSSIGFDGKARGLFPEVLEDIARKENWQIVYVPCEWGNCFDKLRSGEIDLLMAAAVTDKRRTSFDYNSITLVNNWGQLITTTSGVGSDVDSLLELNNTRIAVVKGNIYSEDFKEMLAKFGIKADLVELPSYSDVLKSLEYKEVDAGVVSNLAAHGDADKYDVRTTSIVFAPSELRFMSQKGKHSHILAAIDRNMEQQVVDESSAYQRSMHRLMELSRKPDLPFWVKGMFFTAGAIAPLFIINMVLLRRRVDARTKDLQLEVSAREESRQELQRRNMELAILEEKLRARLSDNEMVYEALRMSEDRHRKVVNDAPVGIIQTAVGGELLSVNPAIAEMFGYASVNDMFFVMSNISAAYQVPEQRDRLVRQVLASEGYVPWEDVLFRRRDGSRFVVSGNMRAVRTDEGEISYLEGFLQDVTERKLTEDALRESEQTLRLYVQSLPLASILLDTDCVVKSWNSSAERMFGYSESEAIGQTIHRLIVSRNQDKSLSPVWERLLDGELDSSSVNENITKDGRSILCEWTNTRFFNSQGEVCGIISVAQDITARRQGEELMVQTEKMMMIGGLAAGMAHEINNPMGIIVQNVQNILRRLSPELPANHKVADETGIRLEQVRQYLEKREILDFMAKIGKAGQRTSKIVANMLQFSRKSNPGRQPGSLSELMDQSLEMVSKDYDIRKKYDFSNIRLVRDYDASMPLVPVNMVEVEQVLINLLKNAAQAMAGIPPGREPEIRLRLYCKNDEAVIQIADNGPGICDTVRKRLFEPFFTTKEVGSGTGLGLYVSYVLITRHAQGSIEVESVPGEGAVFTIRLPLN